MDDQATRQAVFEKVQLCISIQTGGSGHAASVDIVGSTFEITDAEDLGGGLTRYAWKAETEVLTEFYDPLAPGDPEDQVHRSSTRGSIVLDEDFDLTRDDEGRIRIEPYTVPDIEAWWTPRQRAQLPKDWPEYLPPDEHDADGEET